MGGVTAGLRRSRVRVAGRLAASRVDFMIVLRGGKAFGFLEPVDLGERGLGRFQVGRKTGSRHSSEKRQLSTGLIGVRIDIPFIHKT